MNDLHALAAFKALDEGRLQPVDNPTDTGALLPCPSPWCDHRAYIASTDDDAFYGNAFQGRCTQCGMGGPVKRTESEAVTAWNTRHQSETGAALPRDEGLARFGHHPDPAIDFEHEVECCENDAYDLRGEVGVHMRGALLLRIERAMTFRVGGDQGCVSAKQNLRDLEQAMKEGREREYIDAVIAARKPAALAQPVETGAALLSVNEKSVMVCPQCEGEGGYPDGLDEAACHTDCTRCAGNGWIVDLAALAQPVEAGEDGT